MTRCERCGANLSRGALLNAVAENTGDLLDDDRQGDRACGVICCPCGANYRHRAPALLGLACAAASASGAFLLLRAVAGALDRRLADWDPYWQAAALLTVFALPTLPVIALLASLWPVRFMGMGKPATRAPRLSSGMLFQYSLTLAAGGLIIGFTKGFGLMAGFVLLTAVICFYLSGRNRR